MKKEIPKQAFSCKFREIYKNNFFYITPPVVASDVISEFIYEALQHKEHRTIANLVPN